jgi:hypothetical protein
VTILAKKKALQNKPARIERKIGRPSKYDPSYCQGLVDHMKQGLSFETYAAVIGVNQDTLHEWVKVHPAFSEAKKEGRIQSQLKWEQFGLAGMAGKIKGFNSAVYIFNMKNRFAWRDQPLEDNDRKESTLKEQLRDAFDALQAEEKEGE